VRGGGGGVRGGGGMWTSESENLVVHKELTRL